MLGTWLGGSLAALIFVVYWNVAYPEVHRKALRFKVDSYLVSLCTWGFYVLALSWPFALVMSIRAGFQN